ncbi:MAG: hypothetical protein LBH49_00790 [Puniceicoccales bacterium]|nr:hypothetical protein [Puniceicoccales bacterium]
MNKIEKFFEKENLGKLLLRLIVGGFIIAKGVIHISDSATALQSFEGICKLIFGIKIHSQTLVILLSLLLIIFGTFFLIGFHFKKNTFLLLLMFIIKMTYAHSLSHSWMDHQVLYNVTCCAIMISCLFVGPGTVCADKHK